MSLIRPGNVLTVSLGAGAVLAAGTVAILFALKGGEPDLEGYVSIPPPPPETDVRDFVLDPPPLERYAEIGERPLFNDDRLPRPRGEGELAGVDCEATPDAPECQGEEGVTPPPDLDVRLTGVIITPEQKYVMFTDRETKETMSTAVGDPIEGRLAGWRVTEINARNAVFVNEVNDSEATVNLEMHTQTLTGSNAGGAPSQNHREVAQQRAAAARAAQQNEAVEPGNETQADEVRRRIAERRARMRAEAARKQAEMREQQEQQQKDDDG